MSNADAVQQLTKILLENASATAVDRMTAEARSHKKSLNQLVSRSASNLLKSWQLRK